MNADKRRFGLPARFVFICVYLWLVSLAQAAPRWNVQFLYDHADSNFAIEDLDCPTARHCVAAGLIDDKKGHEQGTVVVSSDSGIHWTQYDVKERPISLFFLSDGLGWMVTDRGLWSTEEGGRSWTKIQTRKGILQTWFLDANHGFITGLKGLLEETTNGGKNWAPLQLGASEKIEGIQSLNFDIIEFRGNHGIIVGAPDGSAPKIENVGAEKGAASEEKVTVLETLDGGKTWKSASVPVDGELAQVKMSGKGFAVSLVLYSNPKSPVGSYVFKTQLGTREGRAIFAERDRVVTDIALLDNAGAVLATVEPPGNSTQAPIPGKLRMFQSRDLKVWREDDVDYRIVAQRAVIAAPDATDIWVATDTGAILKLTELAR